MKETIVTILIGLVIGLGVLFYNYIQHYNQDSNSTATSGLFFHKTLMLNQYKLVSKGNGIWGKYHRYSRSDRQTEALTIYCNKYCSE